MDARFTTLDFIAPLTDAEDDAARERGVPPPQAREPMQKVATALRGSGADVTPLSEWDAYGWCFSFPEGEATIEVMTQWSGEWLMLCWPHRSFGDKLRGRKYLDELERGCARISTAVAVAHGVPPPRWRTDA